MSKLGAAVIVSFFAIICAPAAAMAGDDTSLAAYPPPPPKNLRIEANVVCEENAPHIGYLAEAIGFTPSGKPTLALAYGSTTASVPISGLSGTIVYPEGGFPTGVSLTIEINGVSATTKVPVVTEQCGTVSPPRSIEISAFSPVCINDVPYIQYAIKPIGFTSSGKATITFYDKKGNLVSAVEVSSLTGKLLYPGAAVDASGNGTDWPGWKQTDTGEWIIDESDAILRLGLDITVDVEPAGGDESVSDAEPAGFRSIVAQATGRVTAKGSVKYPDETPQCSGPKQGVPTPPPAELPRTGSSSTTTLQVAAVLLVAGLVVAIAAHRRRLAPPAA